MVDKSTQEVMPNISRIKDPEDWNDRRAIIVSGDTYSRAIAANYPLPVFVSLGSKPIFVMRTFILIAIASVVIGVLLIFVLDRLLWQMHM